MQEKLIKLRRKMNWTRIILHLLRNNPSYTNRYYYRFIEIVGPEKYLHSPLVRTEWDGARNSFDKMYGLVAAWSESFDIFNSEDSGTGDLKEYLNTPFQKEISRLKKECDSIENDLYFLIKNSDEDEGKNNFENFIKLKEKIAELERGGENKDKSAYILLIQEIKKAEKIIEIYRQITEFSNTEKCLAVKKLAQEKEEKNKKEEKIDGVSKDVQTDTANATDTLPT